MIYLQGRALSGIVASCDRPTRDAQLRSDRRFSARPVRYIPANAASDRR